MRHKIFWLTGLPCSGKTTLAKEISKHLDAEVLDGDDIRAFMKNNDFSPEGREKHMMSVAELAFRFSRHTPVVVALVSPLRKVRDRIKEKYSNVKEIYLKCGKEKCAERDVKGMWKKAMAGEIKGFTGHDAPYEAPETAFVVDTEKHTVEECVKQILDKHSAPQKYSLFIGRYQPLHDGHKKLMQSVIDEGRTPLVALRETGINPETDPYSVDERRKMFHEAFGDKVRVISVPDVEEVVYGRGVGYGIRQIKLDDKTEEISATKIREAAKK